MADRSIFNFNAKIRDELTPNIKDEKTQKLFNKTIKDIQTFKHLYDGQLKRERPLYLKRYWAERRGDPETAQEIQRKISDIKAERLAWKSHLEDSKNTAASLSGKESYITVEGKARPFRIKKQDLFGQANPALFLLKKSLDAFKAEMKTKRYQNMSANVKKGFNIQYQKLLYNIQQLKGEENLEETLDSDDFEELQEFMQKENMGAYPITYLATPDTIYFGI